MSEEKGITISYFDRALDNLHGAPDVISTKATTLVVVPPFGIGSHTYIVQTYRQKELVKGARGEDRAVSLDTIFLQDVAEGQTIRVVIPPDIADIIARQRDALTTKNRKRGARQAVQTRKELGIEPGFLRKKSAKGRK